jgi:hypothetical protein
MAERIIMLFLICAQVITPAKNNTTGECKDFPTPCDVPSGWTTVKSCTNQQTQNSNILFLGKSVSQSDSYGNNKTAQSVDIFLTLPSGSKIIKQNDYSIISEISINGSEFTVKTAGGPGLCAYEDYGSTCNYTDEVLTNKTTNLTIKDLRIWKDSRGVFSLNPQEGSINNYSFFPFLTKK